MRNASARAWLAVAVCVSLFAVSTSSEGGSGPVTTAAARASEPPGLVSWWRADGNSDDALGAHPGSGVGGLTYVPAVMDQGFAFDGAGGSVGLGNWFNLQTFTIGFWVNPGTTQQQYADIIDNNHTGSRSWVVQQVSTETNRYIFAAALPGATAAVPDLPFTLAPNRWTHVVIVRDGATRVATVYLNGTALPSVTGGGDITYDGTENLHLACHHWLGRNWSGKLDEVKIFNRALSAKEVLRLENPDGPVSWWRAEDSAADAIGNNDGVAVGGATYASGVSGRAFSLNAAGAYISVPDASDLHPTTALTLEAWVYPTDITTDQHILSTAGSGPSPFGHDFYLRLVDRGLELRINDDPLTASGVIPKANRWYLVTATYDRIAGQRRIYVDGELKASNSYGNAINTGHTHLTIGVNGRKAAFGDGLASFAGRIDEVRVYDRAVSAAEVADHYGLVSWWKAEDNATDSVGGLNGTSVGTVSYGAGHAGGKAFALDGSGANVLVGDPVPSPLRIQNGITLSAWIYASEYPGRDGVTGLGLIAGSQNDSAIAGATIFLDGRVSPDSQPSEPGHIHFQIGDGHFWHTTNTQTPVPLNQWVHVVAARRANEDARIYYNGVLQPLTSVPWTGAVSYENAWFAIGQQKDVNRPFKGRIDDVMVFERDITSEEVVEFYRAQTPDAFSFLPVTGVLRLAKVVSNDVAFTGPTGELAIGITGGEYAVSSDNGATWSEFSSAAPATIAASSRVRVRVTASPTYSTTTAATLTVGDVSAAFDVTTLAGRAFADDPLLPKATVVKAVHITDLRQAIDALRVRYGLEAFAWSDPSLAAGGTPIKAVHIVDLRTALDAAYAAATLPTPVYAVPTLVIRKSVVTAADIAELRAAITALW